MPKPQTVTDRLDTYARQLAHETRMRDRKRAEGKPKEAAVHQAQIDAITKRRAVVLERYRGIQAIEQAGRPVQTELML
jgi:hypothetical protein